AFDTPLMPDGFKWFLTHLGLISVFVSFLLSSVSLLREEERAAAEARDKDGQVIAEAVKGSDGVRGQAATSRRILYSIFAALTGALAAALAVLLLLPLEKLNRVALARDCVPPKEEVAAAPPAPAAPAA